MMPPMTPPHRPLLAPEERAALRGARVSMLGELCATVVHDVLQPISASVMRGHAALRWLRLARPDVPEAIAAIERMIVDADRAMEVVTRFRALASDKPAAPETVVLNALARECLAWLDHEFERHRIAVEVVLPRDDLRLLGERVPLQQVLINVLMNAVQAIARVTETIREVPPDIPHQRHHGRFHESGERWIRLTLTRLGREAEIAIQDSGPGFGDAVMARMFDAFFTTRADGMGMGLAICRTIAHAHGGDIRAERPREGGARIVVRLPLLGM